MARPHQPTSVLSGMSAPMRSKISCWRYNGRWSSNFETSTWASRFGPAILPGIGRLGAGSCTIRSQRRQDFLIRAIWITFICAAIMSRSSLTSSPTTRRSPPQSGQQVPGSSSRRSRGVVSETRGRRRKAGVSAASGDSSSCPSSMGASSFSATATNRSSSASSSCSISRSTFSEDLPKASFCNLAIRRRNA
ncbi:hypothetical protein ROG8370_03984 [Roseovarius gaetbuli]|uniref:Uncharacterized protein n=1 Tax=Roseovarius gaetbuli TaxID=1356575 RepID=A0A1X7ADU2_9RHOB|nr:hypothetical protein ROG8370_03984 [Roseovarius gaetbuli]